MWGMWSPPEAARPRGHAHPGACVVSWPPGWGHVQGRDVMERWSALACKLLPLGGAPRCWARLACPLLQGKRVTSTRQRGPCVGGQGPGWATPLPRWSQVLRQRSERTHLKEAGPH